MTLIYKFDPITSEYIGAEQVPDNSVKVEGNIACGVPAFATLDAPLEHLTGYACCYNTTTQRWYRVEDHRGAIVYLKTNLQEVVVDFLGPIPSDLYLLERPEPKNEYQIWKDGRFTYPDLTELRTIIKNDLDKKFEKKIQVPYACGDYYVLPNWATTYTTTLVAMQQDLQEDGSLDEEYKVLLITDPLVGTLKQVKMTTLQEFMPFYNKVKEVYKDLSTKYHDNIAKISTTKTPDALVRLIFNY